jgi:hypothetical protein
VASSSGQDRGGELPSHSQKKVSVVYLRPRAIEAKAENLPPGHGLDQAKGYAACERLNYPFV